MIDLGCGPGHTTRLLANVLDRHVIGLDASDAFLYEARRLQPTRVSFQLHDVTDVAFPTPPAHLMYSRFLLTHLAHLGAVFASWRANLRPGGWILLEEPEWIATEVEPFRVYLDLIARSLNARGTELYIGPRLAAEAAAIGGLTVVIDRVVEHDVNDRDAATMFAWNLPTVRAAHQETAAAGASGTAPGRRACPRRHGCRHPRRSTRCSRRSTTSPTCRSRPAASAGACARWRCGWSKLRRPEATIAR